MKKTKIELKLRRKTNLNLVETIIKSKKDEKWLKVSHILSGSSRNNVSLNLRDIDEQSVEGEKIIIPGKVLGVGNIHKKISIGAFNFSESAKQKLKDSKIPMINILEEIKSNPKADKIKILDKRIGRN